MHWKIINSHLFFQICAIQCKCICWTWTCLRKECCYLCCIKIFLISLRIHTEYSQINTTMPKACDGLQTFSEDLLDLSIYKHQYVTPTADTWHRVLMVISGGDYHTSPPCFDIRHLLRLHFPSTSAAAGKGLQVALSSEHSYLSHSGRFLLVWPTLQQKLFNESQTIT